MSWNHRVVRREFKHLSGDTEVVYAIHEAYYKKPGDTEPNGVTADPVDVHSDTPEGLRWVLNRMLGCLDKPVLEWDEIGGAALEEKP